MVFESWVPVYLGFFIYPYNFGRISGKFNNWVIPIYGGQLVDLLGYWDSWPAAKKALTNNIVPQKVQFLAQTCLDDLRANSKNLKKFIIEGQL